MPSPPIRLAMVTNSVSRLNGGLYEAVCGLSRALLRYSDLQVKVLSARDRHTAEDLPSWDSVDVHLSRTSGPPRAKYMPDLRAGLSEFGPDIIFLHGLWTFHALACARFSDWGRRIPYVVFPHGMLTTQSLAVSSWRKTLAGILFHDRVLRGAACMRALTDQEALDISAAGFGGRIAVFPNGVVIPERSDSSCTKGAGAARARRLVYLGRIHPIKGLEMLIDAIGACRDQRPDLTGGWRVEIRGWGDARYVAGLDQRVRTAGLSGLVSVAGPAFGREKEELLRSAEAFVLPSHGEGLPMAVLEAMSYGIPVLITTTCNLPQVAQRNAGFVVPPDLNSLNDGLKRLFESADRTAMGDRGRDLVATEFSWDTCGRRAHDLVLNLVGEMEA